ncbi:uncharacterized protein LOC143039981 [Oratosquilla oratoria]|uniref:uncharacterized protein LOC143039981 n=1 Tax=Oratosquilla oratoria TaxID=337810 RepID=UPI003F76BED5
MGYRVSVLKGSALQSVMTDSSEDSILHRGHLQHQEDPRLLVSTLEEGMASTRKGKVAFMTEVEPVDYIVGEGCSLRWAGPDYIPAFQHFGYSFAFPFIRSFDYVLRRAAEGGILDSLRRRWRPKGRSCDTFSQFDELGFSKTVFAFTALVGGLVGAVLMLLTERVVARVHFGEARRRWRRKIGLGRKMAKRTTTGIVRRRRRIPSMYQEAWMYY